MVLGIPHFGMHGTGDNNDAGKTANQCQDCRIIPKSIKKK